MGKGGGRGGGAFIRDGATNGGNTVNEKDTFSPKKIKGHYFKFAKCAIV